VSVTKVAPEMEGWDVQCAEVLNAGVADLEGDPATWETVMSYAVAKLVSAYVDIEALVDHQLAPTQSAVSMELASQSVCVALVSLDECSLAFWDERDRAKPTFGSFGVARIVETLRRWRRLRVRSE
jgi:hypothetical protein